MTTQTFTFTAEAEVQTKHPHKYTKHIAVNTTPLDMMKFQGTQTEKVKTHTTATQRQLNIVQDSAVKATLQKFFETLDQLHPIIARLPTLRQDALRCIELIGGCEKTMIANTQSLLTQSQKNKKLT